MTLAATNVLAFDAMGEAFGQWCRQFTLNELMGFFGVAEATAKKWRSGKLPIDKHIAAMAERWGDPFVEHLFAPAVRRAELDMLGQLESVEVQISLMRERMTHEARRRDRLGLAAGAAGRIAGLAVGPADAVSGEAQRLGGEVGPSVGRLAALRHGAIGAVGGMILLAAAMHGPLCDLLDHSSFASRSVRTVSMARVKAARGVRIS